VKASEQVTEMYRLHFQRLTAAAAVTRGERSGDRESCIACCLRLVDCVVQHCTAQRQSSGVPPAVLTPAVLDARAVAVPVLMNVTSTFHHLPPALTRLRCS
jgi:hypothetical protein